MAILPELLVASPTLQDFLIGKDGLPLSAGIVTCYHDNNRQLLKNWYYQSGTPGNYSWIALPNPLTLSAAGTISDANGNDVIPFFYPWVLDSTGQQSYDPYYITVYNSNGELQFTRAFFPFNADEVNPNPPTQDIFTLNNLIVNNRFWRNIGSVNAGTIPLPSPYDQGIGYIQSGNFLTSYNSSGNYYYITLAPSQNDGFSMPDFNYIKNAQGGVESISFLKFPATTSPIITDDVTPEFYIEHICGTQDTDVSIKVYQFPISLHLDTLSGQTASISIQARSNTGGTQLKVGLYQFQGTGNTSLQSTPLGVFPLTTNWQKWNSVTFNFPSNINVVDSSTGDDAWYLQIGMPITTNPFEIDFTLPSLYLNPAADIPTNSFESYDVIDTIINKPRTGDIRTSLNNFYPYGWLPMNGGTIGNSSSNATLRPNIDSWPLYNLLWNNFHLFLSAGNSLIPIYTSAGTISTYGLSSFADWSANKAIALTQTMGRLLLGTAPITSLLSSYQTTYNSAPNTITTTTNVSFFKGMPVYITGTAPAGLAINTIYYVTNFNGTNNFALSSTFANAMAGTVIGIGIGTGIIISALSGSYEGEYAHVQLLTELATHNHTASGTTPIPLGLGTTMDPGGGAGLRSVGSNVVSVTVNNNGSSLPFNVTQPGTFTNIYIKI